MKEKNKNWRKTLVKKLDKLVGDIVKLRDGKCVTCGSLVNPNCGHYFSRVAYSTRWDLNNCYQQCMSCNLRHEYDPYPFTSFMLQKIGQNGIDDLHYKFVHPVKFKNFELLEMCVKFEAQLNEMKTLDNQMTK